VLFVLRPRQTWMPYALPRESRAAGRVQQQLRQAYASTRRVARSGRDPMAQVRVLADLHRSGVLTDDEFSAKAKVLDLDDDVT
jgi:hypothetical protein